MRLLLIFALTFTLSAQQDNKNNADGESIENGNEMMNKVLDALSEKDTMKIINALNKKDIEKLTDCMEDECKMADFLDLMEKILYFFKGISHGDKPIYDLIKAIVKHGPLAELVKELSKELTLEIINALTAKEIEKLTNIGEHQISIFALISIGKKIVPIIKKANGVKGVSKLISIFTAGGDGNTGNDNHNMVEKVMDALSEEHTMKMINAFNTQEIETLTNCLEGGCGMADSLNVMEKMLNVLKGMSHGDKLIYNLIKKIFKHGPLAELVNGLSEECTLEIINALNGKDIDTLMNIGKDHVKNSEIIPVGKKIIPIVKKAKCGKGVSKLISVFTSDEDGTTGLPFYQPVAGGLHPGMAVYMQGAVPEHNRTWVYFQVEFACGQHKGDDVPLHFRSHINAETVGFSTLQDGRWTTEEKHMNPFQKGEQFELFLIVHDFGYQVLVNRKTVCNYRHRIPPQNIRVISIDGDLEVQSLSVIGGQVMTLPYNQPVSGGLHPGMAVYVEGTVPQNANRFKVDFACGKFEDDDILLHFNPRFAQGQVVLNTYQSGRWGNEKLHQMPFQNGKHFEAIFIVNEAEYQVLVNGNPFCNYKHRIPPQFLKFIKFFGNLELQSLTVVGRQIERNMSFLDDDPFTTMYSYTEQRNAKEVELLTGSASYYPMVPYRGNIPGGLGTNRTITVRGFIPKNATRFEINLMAGKNITLHLNSHMKPQRYVAHSYYLNGKWGAEKNDLPFNPFQFGQYFEVSICCDRYKFKVYTSGHHLFNFAPPYGTIGLVRTLEIKGDVTLSYIKY